MKDDLIQEYQEYLNHDKQKFRDTRKRIQLLSFLRLIAFLTIILTLVYFKTLGFWLASPIILLSIILFFFWIKKFVQKEKEKQLYANLIDINQKELIALGEEYSHFDGGNEFIDQDHSFSFDLDLFGEGSIFQFLNRTTTQLGKKRLAFLLQNPETSIKKLEEKQKALLELAKHTRWRHFFAAKGKTSDEDDLKLLEGLSSKIKLPKLSFVRVAVYSQPFLSLLFLILAAFSVLPWGFFVVLVIINGTILSYFSPTIKKSYRTFGKQSKVLQQYRELFILIEEKEFETDQLVGLKKQLFSKGKSANQVLKSLQKAMAEFDYRQNLLVGLVLNALLIWDLQCVLKLFRWQNENEENIHHWFDVIAEFDAFSSLANLNHNHSTWALPSFGEKEFQYLSNDLAHPLINSKKRIGNSFKLNGDGRFIIITGANMAGKSTFLRALGVNMVLALNACRVCASSMSLRPVSLFSNMRTTDNLQKDESYFFAELLRLQKMLDKIRNGERLFFLIDEMLKGTNSKDKLMGSIALVKQLLNLETSGVIATHDLDLTKLGEKYPAQISNQCFDVKLAENELVFDYKFTEGITTTMNASFLMKKMGIIPANSEFLD